MTDDNYSFDISRNEDWFVANLPTDKIEVSDWRELFDDEWRDFLLPHNTVRVIFVRESASIFFLPEEMHQPRAVKFGITNSGIEDEHC